MDALSSGSAGAFGIDSKQFNMFFEKMLDGFAYHKIILDKSGKPIDYVFLEVNSAFERITGLKRNAILGRRVTKVLKGIENDPADWIGIYGKVALTGQPTQFENYAEPLGKWYRVSAYCPEKDHFVALFEDITDRKKAEESLRRGEQRWETTVSSIGDAIITTDLLGNVTFLNRIAENLTGWSLIQATEKPSKEILRIINAQTRKELESPVTLMLKEGRIAALANHTVLIGRNGSQVLIDGSGAPIKDRDDKVIGAVLVFRDITERRRAEEALTSKQMELQTIIDSSRGWIFYKDCANHFIRVNKAFAEVMGLPKEQLEGRSLFDLYPRKQAEAFWDDDKQVITTGKSKIGIIEQMQSIDGVRWVRTDKVPYYDAQGNIVGVIGFSIDITESKLAEQKLWQAKNDWERTFDSVPDFIAILDNNYTITRANQAFAKQLGVTPEQAIGLKCYKCVHGTEIPPELCPHAKTVQDGKEHVAEVHESRLGGEFLVSTTPLRDAQGKMIGSVHVARNITERKKAEESLWKLNRHLRAVSKSNQALMHASDEAKYTQEICEIIVHDCGYALAWVGFAEYDEAKTVRPVAFVGNDKDYIDQLKVTWDANSPRGRGPTGTVIRTGKPYVCKNMQNDLNFAPWREQAARRHFTASCVLPLATHVGKIFGTLNIYSQEVNPFENEEVKLLTEIGNDFGYGIEMLRLRQERERSEAIMHKQAALIDLSPDAIIVRELGGKITFWSRGSERLYGYCKEEAIGKSSHMILKTMFTKPLQDILLDLNKEGHWSGELTHQTKDGRKVIVQSYWKPIFNEKGQITELMESNVDVTDRKQMQIKLEEYAAHLEDLVQERTKQLKDAERLTAIGETAGMVGHDLRNPLQTVTGETYLAKAEIADLPESEAKINLQESINTIAEQIGYMDKIVSDLQDFVRPIKPDKKAINLGKLLSLTIVDVNVPKSIDVETRISQKLPEISVDAQLLKRVFINLVTNAIQAMPQGGSLTVTTQLKKTANHNGNILINVKDTGEGIPEDVKQRIFRPLFTTKSKGQGFGLAVCKRVVEAHGGNITFKSQIGKGSTFTVELPV